MVDVRELLLRRRSVHRQRPSPSRARAEGLAAATPEMAVGRCGDRGGGSVVLLAARSPPVRYPARARRRRSQHRLFRQLRFLTIRSRCAWPARDGSCRDPTSGARMRTVSQSRAADKPPSIRSISSDTLFRLLAIRHVDDVPSCGPCELDPACSPVVDVTPSRTNRSVRLSMVGSVKKAPQRSGGLREFIISGPLRWSRTSSVWFYGSSFTQLAPPRKVAHDRGDQLRSAGTDGVRVAQEIPHAVVGFPDTRGRFRVR
jgi:hypothetical protein